MINLSVVIPVYNGETDLPDLIECLRSQTYPADQVEYLLVDNNSQDNSVSIGTKVPIILPMTTPNLAHRSTHAGYSRTIQTWVSVSLFSLFYFQCTDYLQG